MSTLSPPTRKANRRRSSSVTNALNQVPLNQQGDSSKTSSPSPPRDEIKPLPGRPRKKRDVDALPEIYTSRGFWDDLRTGKWMLVPASSFKILLFGVILRQTIQLALKYLNRMNPKLNYVNPMDFLLYPQGGLPGGSGTEKSWADFTFVAYHVIFWSFFRQFWCVLILRPLAQMLGVKGSKIMRFTEQGYAIVYFSIMGSVGIYVMRGLPTYWYRTEHFWLNYPPKSMTWELKTYYLLQASYWVQQLILLIAKIEKPRKDFAELVAHHIVTLWLIGWSYTVHLTYIGNAIYVTMDVSDVFLALAKCVNYVNETASQPVFAFFVCVWTYFRHYLNLVILWSVYTQFELIPYEERQIFDPMNDKWMPPWMKWQIFVPIVLLQIINLFWYFLILRILYRAVFVANLADERSDDEGEDEAVDAAAKSKGKGRKAE